MKRPGKTALAALLFVALLAGPAFAHPDGRHDHAQGSTDPGEAGGKPAAINAPDVELLDQDGNKTRFRSGVLGDRIVVLDVFYTSCGLVCPILSAIMADLQDSLGERLGRDVALVSVTVDPITDIPQRLKEYSARFNARRGWTFLTGERDGVTQVLKSLGAYTPDFTRHPPMILVGDARRGEWARYYGFPSTEILLEKIEELAALRRSGHPGPAR
jgi:protein SCO1/2